MSRFVKQQTALLNLDSSGANVSSNNNMDLTYYNIDLKALLQDAYDNYDLFNIMLVNMAVNSDASFGSTFSDKNGLSLSLNGLSWSRPMYNGTTKNFTNDCIMSWFNISNVAPQIFNYGNNNIYTFRKQPIVDLNIKVRKLAGSIPTTTTNMPQYVMNFVIWGVDTLKEELPRDKLVIKQTATSIALGKK
jgi:hypothetical protein